MAITNAQQYQQLVNKPADGKRPGYRGPGGYQSGKSDKKSSGMSPGRSQAQFGHTGHAGKTEDQAKSDQRSGRDTPSTGAGSNPFAGHNQAEKKGFQKQEEISRQLDEGTFEPPKKKSFLETYNEKRRKKNKEYIQNLRNKKFKGIMEAYGLTEAQLNDLLKGGGQLDEDFEGGRNLTFTGLQQILDMDPSARNLGQSFNEDLMQGKLGALEMSPRMKKGTGLSTAELFSTTDPTTRIDLPGVLGLAQGDENFSNVLSGLNRIETLDKILDTPGGVKQSDIDNYFSLTMGKGGVDPITGDTVDPLFFEQGGDDRSNESDPCLGPNPPAYCFVNQDPTTPPPPKQTLTSRIIGSQFDPTFFAADGGRVPAMGGGMMDDDPTGGIMDLETGRQMYFLGKLVKKATRAVKKIVKSPIGKAALLYGAGSLGAGLLGKAQAGGGFSLGKGLAGLRGTLFGQAGSRVGEAFVPFKEGLFTKLGLTKGGGSLIPTIKGGITLAGILPFILKGDDEDKFDIEEYYRQGKIANVPLNKRIAGSDFYAADGGLMRAGYQEGGDAEPVAKKTMPLIDMDGMEKDYRETGGFVEMGRMERADDVPARLSKNEFVFTADAVRNAGDGDIDKGAEVMYNMMKNLEDGGDVSEESQGLEGARNMFQTSQRLGEVL